MQSSFCTESNCDAKLLKAVEDFSGYKRIWEKNSRQKKK